MSRFYAPVKIMLVTSYRDVVAAFKASYQFRDSLQFMLRKCENNAFENSDTSDGWLCDFQF